MPVELGKTYDPKAAEERWFQRWIDLGYFKADPAKDPAGRTFAMVIPPPNITGQLHLGHALDNTLQDIIVRTRRMQGYNTLWVPGTDHAGIATQNAVEKNLAKDGKNRHQLGRDAFVDRVWQWREQYGSRILYQLRRLGASCDWSRERFTLDRGLSRAVTRVFVELHRKGLIYKALRLINWCPRCETALSDLEVDHKDADGHLYYIRYPFAAGAGAVTVATTRPETMLGDAAVAVHPDDQRYTAVAGKTVRLPFIGREIKLIADAAVDPNFGTGVVKITPGHDFNDFELGQRHGLAQISVMDTRGRMNDNAGPYRGLERGECRAQIVKDLRAAGLLEKIEPHRHSIGVCSRCDTVVEPMLSEQWFVRVREMAKRAMDAVRSGETTFFPKHWEKTFFNWMENVHDWCVSRQLWWGHRIPAYRCQRCDLLMVEVERPRKCSNCEGTDIVQDDDVLDTWFSSGLWPFSTLGWPDDTPEFRRYYPTSLLITGFDIIFFWVARMMMLGIEFTGQAPFRHVYIHPLVRDEYGRKMTKSRGNVVDPLDLMDQYGTDAVRFTLAQLTVQGRDVILSHERFGAARAFANKIWNAARFVMMNLDGAPAPLPAAEPATFGLAERWILARLDNAVREVTRAIDAYEFNVAAMTLYQFIWHEFCDCYIELAKEPLDAGGARQAATRWVLVKCVDALLRLLHPFMPFISEEIWQVLRPYIAERALSEHLVVAKFPELRAEPWISEADDAAMRRCLEATEAINSLRALLGCHPSQRIRAAIKITGHGLVVEQQRELSVWGPYAKFLAKLMDLQLVPLKRPSAEPTFGPRTVAYTLSWCDVEVESPPGFDIALAKAKLQKELDEITAHANRHEARLNDKIFREKADPDTQDETQLRLVELKSKQIRLKDQLDRLGGSAA